MTKCPSFLVGGAIRTAPATLLRTLSQRFRFVCGCEPTIASVKTINSLQIQKKPTTRVNAAFLFSDDEEDEKRVVRSAKEKR